MIKDDIKTGNGREIIQAAYRVIGAIDTLPKALKVQAVTAVFIAMIETLGLRPSSVLDVVARIIKSEEAYATTKALFKYIQEEVVKDA